MCDMDIIGQIYMNWVTVGENEILSSPSPKSSLLRPNPKPKEVPKPKAKKFSFTLVSSSIQFLS